MEVQHNVDEQRFEVRQGELLAGLFYRRHGRALSLMHTEVPDELSGQGIAGRLIKAAMDYARNEQLPVVVYCPFVKSYLERRADLKEGVQLINVK